MRLSEPAMTLKKETHYKYFLQSDSISCRHTQIVLKLNRCNSQCQVHSQCMVKQVAYVTKTSMATAVLITCLLREKVKDCVLSVFGFKTLSSNYVNCVTVKKHLHEYCTQEVVTFTNTTNESHVNLEHAQHHRHCV